jgi:uncharacterized protein YhaN
MRFSKLDLDKFGMFTGTVLNVSEVGVNVIVGKNEAGKSTAMDAITQLLYGIPMQSVHDYVHKYPDLRIGGTLVGSDGKFIEIYRIKKNGPSLRSADGDTIGDEVLRELLCGVNEDVFTQLFSISHDEIAEGGAALLDSEGELGAALFGAGTGLTTLNAVLAKLDSKAGDLFKPRAPGSLVNADVRRYKELMDRVKETSQSAAEVERLNTTLRTAEADQTAKDAELKDVSSALNKANRVRRSHAAGITGRRGNSSALDGGIRCPFRVEYRHGRLHRRSGSPGSETRGPRDRRGTRCAGQRHQRPDRGDRHPARELQGSARSEQAGG